MPDTTLYTPGNFPQPGTSRLTVSETFKLALDNANVTSAIIREGRATTWRKITLWTAHGTLEFAQDPYIGPSWSVAPHPGPRASQPRWEASARAFTNSVLAVLDDLCEKVPANHLPGSDITDLTSDDQALLRHHFPEAFVASSAVRAQFGGGLAALAREIAAGRTEDTRLREEAAWHRRLKKQFDLLPAGTILATREGYPGVATVSDEPGRQTRRSLDRHLGARGTWKDDLNKENRAVFGLMTPERAARLRPGLLSSHQVLSALQQAKELAPLYPDLA